jgi:tetratricopeptide (TPR) repeat protein
MSRSRLNRLILIVLGTSLVLAGTATAFFVLNRRDVTTTSAEAYRYYRLGRENELKLYHKEAMSAYGEALRHDGHFVMATVRLARYMAERDPERAKSMVQRAKQDQDSITPREQFVLRIFEAHMAKRDAKEMEALFDEYVRKFPKDAEPYRLRGMFYLNHQRPAEAVRDLETMIAINPNDAMAYNSLGYYWAGMGDYAKAEDYFKRYRFLAPDQANPYDSLGELYANTGRYEEAEESLKKALEIKPDFFYSVARFGTIEIGRGNPAAAAEYFRRAAEMTGGPGLRREFTMDQAQALIDAGRNGEALELFEKMRAEVESLPGEEGKRLAKYVPGFRAFLDVRLGRLDFVEADLTAAETLAAQMKPEDRKHYEPELLFFRGLLAQKRDRHEEAADLLTRSVADRQLMLSGFEIYPTLTLRRIALADSLWKLGRTKEAEEVLRAVLKRNPKFQPAVAMEAALRGPAVAPVAAR